MKKALALILAAAMTCSLLLTGCGGGSGAGSASGSTAGSAAKQSLTLGTGGTTGTYYAVGGVMSTVLGDKLSLSSLTVTSTGASKANIQLIDDGEADLAIVQNAFAGIRACVCALVLNATLKIWKSTVIDLPTALIFIAVFVISVIWGLSPALIVIVAGLIGIGLKRARGWDP